MVSPPPPGQVRAVLVIQRSGRLNLSGPAGDPGASNVAASRLCDQMEAELLMTRARAAAAAASSSWSSPTPAPGDPEVPFNSRLAPNRFG